MTMTFQSSTCNVGKTLDKRRGNVGKTSERRHAPEPQKPEKRRKNVGKRRKNVGMDPDDSRPGATLHEALTLGIEKR
mgnify:CR=1 FL=1